MRTLGMNEVEIIPLNTKNNGVLIVSRKHVTCMHNGADDEQNQNSTEQNGRKQLNEQEPILRFIKRMQGHGDNIQFGSRQGNRFRSRKVQENQSDMEDDRKLRIVRNKLKWILTRSIQQMVIAVIMLFLTILFTCFWMLAINYDIDQTGGVSHFGQVAFKVFISGVLLGIFAVTAFASSLTIIRIANNLHQISVYCILAATMSLIWLAISLPVWPGAGASYFGLLSSTGMIAAVIAACCGGIIYVSVWWNMNKIIQDLTM